MGGRGQRTKKIPMWDEFEIAHYLRGMVYFATRTLEPGRRDAIRARGFVVRGGVPVRDA